MASVFPITHSMSSEKISDLYTRSLSRLRDVGFAIGLVFILVVLIFPMPKWLLDTSLALSIMLSVMILMTVIFIEKSLDFSVFPTILLVSTIFRLALNLASTRLILSHGHEGVHAAGEVIYAFGSFIMGGNFVIGVIVFSILVIVNFIVITKGSGRIAEVSARFTLDALPGKQMAIDADLSTGIIDEKIARARRKSLEDETNFYGSMDGAAKFVRGDAIAGVIITIINIAAGIIIGILQKGITLHQASVSYTLLTVGDGLVSQIPALIVSTAAGMLVSKSGTEGAADKALFAQLGGYPNALGMSSALMLGMALLPGIPKIPFLSLSALIGYVTYVVSQTQAKALKNQANSEDKVHSATKEETVSDLLQVENVRLELGIGLLALLNKESQANLADQIKTVRRRFILDIGFLMPSVRIQDNVTLPSNSYVIKVKEMECARGEVRPEFLLILDPSGELPDIKGEQTTEPTFGLPAVWANPLYRVEAESKGYTVVEPTTVLLTHFSEVIKGHVAELFSSTDLQRILEDLPPAPKKLIADVVPTQIGTSALQRVFQHLLEEGVSIRDSATIIESVAEASAFTRSVTGILEHVRLRLSRQICFANLSEDGLLHILSLSPEWEKKLTEALVGDGEVRQLALAPSELQRFVTRLRQIFDLPEFSRTSPVLVVPGALRSAVRSILERIKPEVSVMSQSEVHSKIKIRTVAAV